MRYVLARYNEQQKELAYRIYVTDALMYIPQMRGLSVRYYDIVNPKPVDNRTGDEIALDVIKKLDLRIE